MWFVFRFLRRVSGVSCGSLCVLCFVVFLVCVCAVWLVGSSVCFCLFCFVTVELRSEKDLPVYGI